MTKKAKWIRLIVNSVLFVAIIALAVTVYQAGTQRNKEEAITPQVASDEDSHSPSETTAPMVDAGTTDVEAELAENGETGTDTAAAEGKKTTADAAGTESGDSNAETADAGNGDSSAETANAENNSGENLVQAETPEADAGAEETADAAAPAESSVAEANFTEESLMVWPLNGEILMDYNMEHTIYHPTLDQYKCSEGIAIQSSVGAPVLAAAGGTVTAIENTAETGTTVVVDLGNGYQSTYGQLKDLNVAVGQAVPQGTILGYVNDPTKYYTEEGSNLYFAMSKDGTPIDPIQYLP